MYSKMDSTSIFVKGDSNEVTISLLSVVGATGAVNDNMRILLFILLIIAILLILGGAGIAIWTLRYHQRVRSEDFYEHYE